MSYLNPFSFTAYLANYTLSYYFKKLSQKADTNSDNNLKTSLKKLTKLIDNVDNTCTKQELGLEENGNQTLLPVESTILIASAMSKCIKIDHFDFSNLFLDFAIQDYYKSSESIYCTQYHLQKLEPESKLARISKFTDEFKLKCLFYGRVNIHSFSDTINSLEKSVGNLDGTCAEVSDEFRTLVSYKALLLASEQNEELKRSEMKNLFDNVTNKLHIIANCILSKVKNINI